VEDLRDDYRVSTGPCLDTMVFKTALSPEPFPLGTRYLLAAVRTAKGLTRPVSPQLTNRDGLLCPSNKAPSQCLGHVRSNENNPSLEKTRKHSIQSLYWL